MSHIGNLNVSIPNTETENSNPIHYWGGGHFVKNAVITCSNIELVVEEDGMTHSTNIPYFMDGVLSHNLYSCEIDLFVNNKLEGTYYEIINKTDSTNTDTIQFNIPSGIATITIHRLARLQVSAKVIRFDNVNSIKINVRVKEMYEK